MPDRDIILSHFRSFIAYLQACLAGTEDTKDNDVEGTYFIRDIYAGCTCIEGTYISSIGAIKRSIIYLQSSGILKLKQYGIRLETRVGAG